MATVFKRGNVGKYQIAWYDHLGKRRIKSSGTTDKAAATRIANKIENEVALRKECIIDPRLDALLEQAKRSLKDSLNDYDAAMNAKGTSSGHIDATQTKIESIANSVGMKVVADLTADAMNDFAANQRAEGKSARTIESYIQAAKGFTRWLVINGKLVADPLATVKKPSTEDDRRVVRRYLTREEWTWLDSVSRSSPTRYGMTGLERALLYSTAIQTGLRSNELRSLTRGKLNLTINPPFILAKPAGTKNKKLARQYVQPELAAELMNLAKGKLGGTAVFDMPSKFDIADMLRADLADARLKWLDTFDDAQDRIERDASDFLRSTDSEEERIDFHSLRHTTATWLIQSGADIKTVQAILRHSDIKLTLQRYGHLYKGAESDAVARIRDAFTQPMEQLKTGTSDPQQKRQQLGCFPVRSGATPYTKTGEQGVATFVPANPSKTRETQQKQGFSISSPSRTRTYDLRIRNPSVMSFSQCF